MVQFGHVSRGRVGERPEHVVVEARLDVHVAAQVDLFGDCLEMPVKLLEDLAEPRGVDLNKVLRTMSIHSKPKKGRDAPVI